MFTVFSVYCILLNYCAITNFVIKIINNLGVCPFIDRVVALESHVVRAGSLTQDDGHDLHILAGHEASY